jgi:hypothetical protein
MWDYREPIEYRRRKFDTQWFLLFENFSVYSLLKKKWCKERQRFCNMVAKSLLLIRAELVQCARERLREREREREKELVPLFISPRFLSLSLLNSNSLQTHFLCLQPSFSMPLSLSISVTLYHPCLFYCNSLSNNHYRLCHGSLSTPSVNNRGGHNRIFTGFPWQRFHNWVLKGISGVFCMCSKWPSDCDVTIQLAMLFFLVVGVAICFHSETSAGVYSFICQYTI